MNSLLSSPKVKIVAATLLGLVLLVILLFKTGLLKASFKITNSSQPSSDKSVSSGSSGSKSEPTARAVTFGGTDSKPEFSINPPTGWVKGDGEEGSDLALGSSLADKLSNGEDFTPNIVVAIGRHRFSEKSIDDYMANWDKVVVDYLPSVQFLKTYQTQVSGLPAYVQDRINPRADGEKIRQLHYKFFIDKNFTMAVTASVPEATWAKHEAVIKSAIESIRLTKASTLSSSGSDNSLTGDSQTLLYENTLRGVSLEYPSTWEKKENVGPALLVLSTPTGANLNLLVQGQASQSLTLEYYNELSLKQLAGLGATSLEQNDAFLADEPAYQVIYTLKNETLKLWQIWMIKDNLAYLLTYTARAENFETHLADVQRMVESFKVN